MRVRNRAPTEKTNLYFPKFQHHPAFTDPKTENPLLPFNQGVRAFFQRRAGSTRRGRLGNSSEGLSALDVTSYDNGPSPLRAKETDHCASGGSLLVKGCASDKFKIRERKNAADF